MNIIKHKYTYIFHQKSSPSLPSNDKVSSISALFHPPVAQAVDL